MVLALLLLACSDYTLDPEDEGKTPFETGESPPPDSAGDTAPADDTAPVDTGACTLDVPAAAEVGVSSTCGLPPVADPWQVELRDLWAGPDDAHGYYMSEQPITANLNDDNGDGRIDEEDVSDIVVMIADDVCVSDLTELLALSGDDLHPLFRVGIPWLDLHTPPAVGDTDGDGVPEIVVHTDLCSTLLVDHRGEVRWESSNPYQYNLPGAAIADLEGDGDVEVLIGKTVLDAATGEVEALLPEALAATGGADLDQDGVQEVLYDGYAFDPAGEVLWDVPYRAEHFAVLDLDGDPAEGEVVWTANTHLLVERGGRKGWWKDTGRLLGPPTVADLDGDGSAEIVAARDNGMVTAWDKEGNERWTTRIEVYVAPGIAAADLDRDGAYELAVAGAHHLYLLEGDGSIAWQSPEFELDSALAFATCPVFTDLDGDGSAEIVHIIEEDDGGTWSSRMLIWSQADRAWPPTVQAWSQFSFSHTVRDEHGAVPARPAPSWVGPELFRGAPSDAEGRPDLRVSIHDLCVEGREAASRARVAVQVQNVGPVSVPAGTMVSLYRDDGGALTLVAEAPLPEAVPAGWAAAGLVFELRVADLGTDGLVAEVDGARQVEECVEDDNTGAWRDGGC